MRSPSEALGAAMVYRHLMKAVKQHTGREGHKCHFTDFISQEFRKRCEQLDSVPQKLKLARDYTVLLNTELLFPYNIAVDRSNEMSKVLGKSAASVGLQLPQVYQT